MKEIVLVLKECPGESLGGILAGWLAGWSAGRPARWLAAAGWLAGRLAAWLASRLAGRPAGVKTLYFLCVIGVFAKNVIKLMLFSRF